MIFDSFIIDTSNITAYTTVKAAVQAVADKTGLAPQFIWGPSGVGKTHLLYAAKNACSSGCVIYRRAEDIARNIVDVIKARPQTEGKKIWAYIPECLNGDLLLIDDLHYLCGKLALQRELLCLLGLLEAKNTPVILASDSGLDQYPVLAKAFPGAESVHRIILPSLEIKREWIRKQVAYVPLDLSEHEITQLAAEMDILPRLRGELNRMRFLHRVSRSANNSDP